MPGPREDTVCAGGINGVVRVSWFVVLNSLNPPREPDSPAARGAPARGEVNLISRRRGAMEPVADQKDQDPGGDHEPPAEPSNEGEGGEEKKKVKRPLKPLSQRKVKDYNDGLAKRGVVYLSRVPPFMKPAKVKHLMEQHGVVTRVSE